MHRRIEAIDSLRGLTIFMMILCASIGYASDLPAWMFHCQCPPPTYAFNPDVRGITWVDLVFPFFIFSMGAAFPLALSRKIEKGEGWLKISLSVVKRWAVLVAFALVLGNADSAGASQASEYVVGLWRLGVWLALFAALVRTSRKWVNIAGWVAVAALMAVEQFCLSVPLSIHHNDIIILLLSTVALLGSFIWLLTRKHICIRIAVWVLCMVLKLFGLDFAQYLVIALPATFVGDLFLTEGTPFSKGRRTVAAAVTALLAAVFPLWALFTREVGACLAVSLCLGASFVAMTARDRSHFSLIGKMGFIMLVCGVLFDWVDGGIAKDYCNMSYLLTTGGQSCLVLCFLMMLESYGAVARNLTLPGRNPMIAYTIGWYVVCPLLTLIGFQGWYDAVCVGHPLLGVIRGLAVTCLTVGAAAFFTRKNVYWRS